MSEFVSIFEASLSALEPTRREIAVRSMRRAVDLLSRAADDLEAGDDCSASYVLDVYRLLALDGLSAARPLVERVSFNENEVFDVR